MSRPRIPARFMLSALALALALPALAPTGTPVAAAAPHAVRSANGMVVVSEALASQAGAAVLEDGGTAADAAVAVALALAVTYPQAGNLGGGGFALLRDEDGQHFALDFRETAPMGLTAEAFLDDSGKPRPGLSLQTGLGVGVPGSVDGLVEIHRRWGKLPWKRLVEPAIRLAADGFPVYPVLASDLEDKKEHLGRTEATREVFFVRDRPLREGEILRQPDLAATLRRIAEHGRDGFYAGRTARALARAVRDAGGVLTRKDLAAYRSVLRTPLSGRYRGYEVVSFPPPSSGGVLLLQMLAMLEPYELSDGFGASRSVHLMTEIQRRAYADRAEWLGDPDHTDVPLAGLLSPDYIAERGRSIRLDAATSSEQIRPGVPQPDNHDTLHISIADAQGRVVALTTTLNTNFGSGIVAAGTGVLLNNELDDFSLAPGVPNVYGLVGGEANAVRPGKRPLSSMTPTIVEYPERRERPYLVLGSPGGGRIINSVFQVVVNMIDHRMPLQSAVNAPRTHHQWLPDILFHEPRGLPADVIRALEKLGHRLQERDEVGNVNAIATDEQGSWLGAADPRRGGVAVGQP